MSAEFWRSLFDSFCVVVESWPGELSRGVAVSGGLCVVVGLLLLFEFVCGETQEDLFSEVSREILSDLEILSSSA